MYKWSWDTDTNGVVLLSGADGKTKAFPRPVFFEELDLLGFDKFWDYPTTYGPLLWSSGNKYYYKGKPVAEVRNYNIFKSPRIVLSEEGKNLKLEPINIKKVVEKNRRSLFVLENEALDFIEHTYRVYRKEGYIFAIGYSGGKDSQVVMDLVTRVIPPDDLIVIFSNTTMEISCTYKNVEETREKYKKKYPALRFYTATPLKPAIEFWKEFGPPSVRQRWCCTVTKTAPFHRVLRSLYPEKDRVLPIKVLVFEGVRADESIIRARYERIRKNTRHFYQVNAEVIRDWNTTEVFLYMFSKGLNINEGYRYGLDRVGCSLCPFASSRNEYILYKIEKDMLTKFIDVVRSYGKSLGLSGNDITEFIADGQWKKRAGGMGLKNDGTMFLLSSKKGGIEAILKKPKENVLEWLKTVGDLHYVEKKNNVVTGELRIKDETLQFTISKNKKSERIWIDTGTDVIIRNLLKKVLYKSTYCVHCGACVEECPTGALTINGSIRINASLCVHCGNCLNFVEKGCLAAKSLTVYGGERPMAKDRIATSRFQNFGLRENWLLLFLHNLDDWFLKTNLGNRQVESLKVWLRGCEFMDRNNEPTIAAKSLSTIVDKHKLPVWGIVWTNLYYNVNLIKWYLNTFDWKVSISRKDLISRLLEDDDNARERTTKNAISSLLNFFDCSPVGRDLGIGVIDKTGKERYIRKIGKNDIHPLVIAYSLYKAAEHLGRRDFTVSELYDNGFEGGPYKLFGVMKDHLERVLRGLQEDKKQILRVDIVADLDNLYLRNDLSSLDIIRIMGERLG